MMKKMPKTRPTTVDESVNEEVDAGAGERATTLDEEVVTYLTAHPGSTFAELLDGIGCSALSLSESRRRLIISAKITSSGGSSGTGGGELRWSVRTGEQPDSDTITPQPTREERAAEKAAWSARIAALPELHTDEGGGEEREGIEMTVDADGVAGGELSVESAEERQATPPAVLEGDDDMQAGSLGLSHAEAIKRYGRREPLVADTIPEAALPEATIDGIDGCPERDAGMRRLKVVIQEEERHAIETELADRMRDLLACEREIETLKERRKALDEETKTLARRSGETEEYRDVPVIERFFYAEREARVFRADPRTCWPADQNADGFVDFRKLDAHELQADLPGIKAAAPPVAEPKRRGRPPGSKNKPKGEATGGGES